MVFWYDHNVGAGGWIAMAIGMVLFWGLVIGVGVMLFRAFGRSSDSALGTTPTTHAHRPSPEQLLAERFARGEIDEDEYHQRLAALRGPGPLAKHG
jgi:putative membrane protein